MSDVTVSIDLDATPAEVWALVEPVERHVDWMADAVSIRFETDQTRGVGTSFLCDTKVGPIRLTDRMEITEWVPADDAGAIGRMGVRHTGIVTGTGVFTIEPITRPANRSRDPDRTRPGLASRGPSSSTSRGTSAAGSARSWAAGWSSGRSGAGT